MCVSLELEDPIGRDNMGRMVRIGVHEQSASGSLARSVCQGNRPNSAAGSMSGLGTSPATARTISAIGGAASTSCPGWSGPAKATRAENTPTVGEPLMVCLPLI